ncbi:MAG: glycosyltransferase [Lachnospiraceae bacterium]|nr:glycosyltransferase [Lachnospiraceae bacterium]
MSYAGVPKVAVLMSTYNGEKFLKEQIESILNQRNVEIKIYIRDDGSTDGTKTILQNYVNHENIIIEYGSNVGVGKSFMSLVYKNVMADYFAFSDQDDIWMEDKLISAIQKIGLSSKPVLYVGNQILTDGYGNEIGVRWEKPIDLSYHQVLCNNRMTGCTMVWNESFQKLVGDKDRRVSEEFITRHIHDVWFGLVSTVAGNVIFDRKPYIMYRQHDNNVAGAYEQGWKKNWKKRIKRWMLVKKLGGTISSKALEVCNRYPEYISGSKAELMLYCNYRNNLKSKLELIRNEKVSAYMKGSYMVFLMKVILNLL